jgi:hypothetical protein
MVEAPVSPWWKSPWSKSNGNTRALVRVLFWSLIATLYALGGVALYLRAQFGTREGELPPAPTVVVVTMQPTATHTLTPAPTRTPTPYPTITPTPTLYPTLTPKP